MALKNSKKWFNKRENAKKLDVKESLKAFEEDFYVYFPSPDVNLEEYMDEDDNVDVDSIPDEQLLEFKCRYVTSGEFREYCTPTPNTEFLTKDVIKDLKNIKKEELEDRIATAIIESLNAQHNYNDAVELTVFHAVLDPNFETVEQVRSILPTQLLELIYDECTKFVDGTNLATK